MKNEIANDQDSIKLTERVDKGRGDWTTSNILP